MSIIPKIEKEPTDLEQAMNRILETMGDHEPFSNEYTTMVEQLTKLHKIKQDTTPDRMKLLETLAPVAGNLAGLLMIINHERINVISTKALGFVLKTKI